MQILILAAGSDLEEEGLPVFLSEENDGRTLLERLVESVQPLRPRLLRLIFRADAVRRFRLDHVAQQLHASIEVVALPDRAQGSACTALYAMADIDANEPLLLLSANELIDKPLHEIIDAFSLGDHSAGVVAFDSLHPRFSFVRLDNQQRVLEVAQHNPISRWATAGLFWARRAGDLLEAIKQMIRKDMKVDGVYYLCPALNELILAGQSVGACVIERRNYLPLKTVQQVHRWQEEKI